MSLDETQRRALNRSTRQSRRRHQGSGSYQSCQTDAENTSQQAAEVCIYDNRTPGCHRDSRDPRRSIIARIVTSEGEGQERSVPEQLETSHSIIQNGG